MGASQSGVIHHSLLLNRQWKAVEDLLDRGAVEEWWVEDAEQRPRSANGLLTKHGLSDSPKKNDNSKRKAVTAMKEETDHLSGWAEFDREGFLK